jgi:septal ring factor EnvC (AmiA/AmiB activator)
MSARRPRRRIAAAAATTILLTLAGAGARGEEPDAARLEEVERSLEQDSGRAASLERESVALAGEVSRLQRDLVAAAKAAQDREEEMSELEATLATLEEAAAERGTELARRRGQLTSIVAALQRLALQPPEAMLLGPATPLDTVRGATLLRVALPAVEGRARSLRAELDSLRELREQIDTRQRALADAAAALAGERERLGGLLEEKTRLRAATESEREAVEQRLAALSREAADLKDLIARIALASPPVPAVKPPLPDGPEAEAAPEAPPGAEPAALRPLDRPPEIRQFPAAKASLVLPVRGRITGRYGDVGDGGQAAKGVLITTRPQAQIVAPFDGQVMFRGPFRGYGEILILEHAGGYHTLLAGLGRTDAIVGQWLLAGEPVGVMGARGGGNPELYLELRRDGQPINPLPWLDISDSKTE